MSSQRRKCVCSQDGCQTVTMGARGGDSHRNDNKLKMQTSPNKYTQYLYSWSPLGGGGGEFGFQSSHSSSSSKSSSSSSSSSSSESRRHFFGLVCLGGGKRLTVWKCATCAQIDATFGKYNPNEIGVFSGKSNLGGGGIDERLENTTFLEGEGGMFCKSDFWAK